MPNDQAELEALLMSRSLTDEELLRATETAPDYRILPDATVLKIGGQSLIDRGRAAVYPVVEELVAAKANQAMRVGTGAGTHGEIEVLDKKDSSPATRFVLPDGTIFGIVSSTTQPFCATCDRSRVTADGMWYRCLYARTGTDLRQPLRAGAGFEQLREIVREGWEQRRDQGAVERLARKRRRALIPVMVLKSDPHLEMHTRGG